MSTYLHIVQIILSATLITLVILQSKGGGLSRMMGGQGGIYKTRRGFEKTLYNVTIGTMVAFFLFSLISVIFQV